MSWYHTKLRKTDIKFSRYIREKANWTCEKCGKVCKIGDEIYGQLQASHYFSRRHENTRFDERNVHALCAGCHRRMDEYKPKEDGEYDIWMKEKLGEKEYKLLYIAHLTRKKRDDKFDMFIINNLLN